MGKEIKWVLWQGAGEDQPVERRAHYPEPREMFTRVMSTKSKDPNQSFLSTGTGTYCNAYTPSLRMRGMDF